MSLLPSKMHGKLKLVASVAALLALSPVILAYGNPDRPGILTTNTPTSIDGIVGTWRVVSVNSNGRDGKPNEKMRYSFQDGRLTVQNGNQPSADLTYTTDRSTTPHHLDVIVSRGASKRVSAMSYRVDGDSLTICYPKPNNSRPDDLVSKPGQRRTLIVMKRVSTAQATTTTSVDAEEAQPGATVVESPEKDAVDAFAVGQVVLANWTSDRYWYSATILKKVDDLFRVRYFDDIVEDIPKERIMAEKLKAGDQIYANWKGDGTYYSAEVTSRDGDYLHVVYNDGDEEKITIARVRVKQGDDRVRVRRATPGYSNSNRWSYVPRRNSGSSTAAQIRQYQMQQQANAYRRQAEQLRSRAIREATESAEREMRNFRSQHRPYSY